MKEILGVKDQKLLKMAEKVQSVLTELGLYKNIPEYMREHITDTPYRIVKAWKEFTVSLGEELVEPTSFSNPTNELVYVTDISFNSLCCHHFFPFHGKIHIAYLPKEVLLGLSKFPRIVKHFAKRPQIQEVMVNEIADYIFEVVDPAFCMIICKALHTCCSGRGVESHSPMIVSAIRSEEGMEKNDIKSFKDEILNTLAISNL